MRSLIFLFPVLVICAFSAFAQEAVAPKMVDLKSADGTLLKASYFAAAKSGPGVVLYHQSERTRHSWDELAAQLAAGGINVLTVDSRAHGESGGRYDTDAERAAYWKSKWQDDLEAAIAYLIAQPGVNRDVIGAGGAGVIGVENAVELARRHPAQVKSLALLSGETSRAGLEFLHQAPQLPELFVVDDNDEYPPIQEEMKLLYISASSPNKQFVHYSQAQDAPWLWYETFLDSGKAPAHGGHGTDMFKPHPELVDIIVHWFASTLLKTPAPPLVDTLATGDILNQLQFGGENGIAQVKQQLLEARKKDPQAQLFPEVTADSIGENYEREGDPRTALEVYEVVELAYPNSADLQTDIADAYLETGQPDMARAHAQRALGLLDAGTPESSWSNTKERRGEVRKSAEDTLKKIEEKK